MPADRQWLVEMGHTRIKWAPLESAGRPGRVRAAGHEAAGSLAEELAAAGPGRAWLAAVPGSERVEALTGWLEARGLEVRRILTGDRPLPVAPAYPGLGVDRWLAMQPVWAEVAGAFCLADCGSALTVDVVDGAGRHRGGWIMAGLGAARRGLLELAPGLQRPKVPPGDPACPAEDTATAVERGLALQQAGAVAVCLASAERVLGVQLPLWLTGGDAGALESRFPRARLEPDLVLRGLAMAASEK